MLRADLEAKPIGKSEGGNVELAELQKRLERKADVDIIDQLLRASTNNKEVQFQSFKCSIPVCVVYIQIT